MVGASSCSSRLQQELCLLSLCWGLSGTVLLHGGGSGVQKATLNSHGSDEAAQRAGRSEVEQHGDHHRGQPETRDPEYALADAARRRLELSKPLAWMHVPKCGTSLLNSLIHLPTICPTVKPDFAVDHEHCSENSIDFEVGFDALCREKCPGLACPDDIHVHHKAAGAAWDSVYKRHAVAMFREPVQRTLSAYYDKDWRFNGWPAHLFDNKDPDSLLQFANVTQGCVTKMLTRKEALLACQVPPFEASPEEVRLAKRRLREGFVFVGIVEEWELSMCLLHKMLGGSCKGVDLMNNRPGINGHLEPYDVQVLGDFRDHADGEVYMEARKIFHENLEKFHVSRSSCAACYEEAAREARVQVRGPSDPCKWE